MQHKLLRRGNLQLHFSVGREDRERAVFADCGEYIVAFLGRQEFYTSACGRFHALHAGARGDCRVQIGKLAADLRGLIAERREIEGG
ncbi:hypothetical protein SDC9_185927 [bioreactor metagenome]|uniref:Uncharacterized protein n=1 Tax=bioreactor metagenome TaxID=1076179 RepID=A0A645HSN8_9ZZZZ